jgi:Uma2 family endonuclease
MTTRTSYTEEPPKLADLIDQLGGVPLDRIWAPPAPGSATEEDLLEAHRHPGGKLVELVDGVLVEKAVGTKEALLGGVIVQLLWNYVQEHDLGQVLPADGMLRLEPGLVRIPDVSFVPWEQIPDETMPKEAVASLVPALAVEVLSPKNTRGEIDRKLRDLFLAGTRLVWVIDPKSQTARVYTSPTDSRKVSRKGALDGGKVLPGFRLPLADLFARLERRKKK